jgi:hypothetical protein
METNDKLRRYIDLINSSTEMALRGPSKNGLFLHHILQLLRRANSQKEVIKVSRFHIHLIYKTLRLLVHHSAKHLFRPVSPKPVK